MSYLLKCIYLLTITLFTRVERVDQTHEKLVKDLRTITNWAYQWKMVFNPDITKQAIEVIFLLRRRILNILSFSSIVYLYPVKIIPSIWVFT